MCAEEDPLRTFLSLLRIKKVKSGAQSKEIKVLLALKEGAES